MKKEGLSEVIAHFAAVGEFPSGRLYGKLMAINPLQRTYPQRIGSSDFPPKRTYSRVTDNVVSSLEQPGGNMGLTFDRVASIVREFT